MKPTQVLAEAGGKSGRSKPGAGKLLELRVKESDAVSEGEVIAVIGEAP